MKSKRELVFITLSIAVFGGLLLAGCSSENGPSTFPHVLGGIEVPQDVLNEPRVVPVPTKVYSMDSPYLRLGDVPAKPTTFSPKPVLDQAMNELEFDRKQANQAEQDYLHPQPTTPPDLY